MSKYINKQINEQINSRKKKTDCAGGGHSGFSSAIVLDRTEEPKNAENNYGAPAY